MCGFREFSGEERNTESEITHCVCVWCSFRNLKSANSAVFKPFMDGRRERLWIRGKSSSLFSYVLNHSQKLDSHRTTLESILLSEAPECRRLEYRESDSAICGTVNLHTEGRRPRLEQSICHLEWKSMEMNESVVMGSKNVKFSANSWRVGYCHLPSICKRKQEKVANVQNVVRPLCLSDLLHFVRVLIASC